MGENEKETRNGRRAIPRENQQIQSAAPIDQRAGFCLTVLESSIDHIKDREEADREGIRGTHHALHR